MSEPLRMGSSGFDAMRLPRDASVPRLFEAAQAADRPALVMPEEA